MSENNSSSTNFGVSFSSLLFITFLVLKLTKVIAWSWWWVTAPLWMPLGFVAILGIVLLIIWLISKCK